MSDGPVTSDRASSEPSWTTALSEADAASRQLRLAAASTERLSRELHALHHWSETTGRLDLAHALTDGPDGGALSAVVAVASDPAGDPGLRSTAQMLLERLSSALALESVGERGQLLSLRPEQLAEFDVRGRRPDPEEGERRLYRVVRPGWLLDGFVVVRPLLEPTAAEERGRETS